MRSVSFVTAVLFVACCTSFASVYAGADAPPATPEQVRNRIVHDVADALSHQGEHATTPAPAPMPSRPAKLAHAAPAKPAPHAEAAEASAPADTTADGVWAELLSGNQRFVAGRLRTRPLAEERAELEHGQHPRAIILGCADSRVSPELVFDQSLGDVFVVRTAGNIVDPIALGSIEYAAEHLHAKLLVVLGHSGCGAVKASAGSGDMPSAYLQAIVDRIRPIVQRLSACFEGEELIERSVIANARQSAQDVVANSAILREEVAKGQLRVVSAVYDLHTGAVTPVSAPAATAQATTPAH